MVVAPGASWELLGTNSVHVTLLLASPIMAFYAISGIMQVHLDCSIDDLVTGEC